MKINKLDIVKSFLDIKAKNNEIDSFQDELPYELNHIVDRCISKTSSISDEDIEKLYNFLVENNYI